MQLDLTMVEKWNRRWYGHIFRSPGLWHCEDNSAGDSEKSKKERKTEEEMGIQYQRLSRIEGWGKVEMYCFNVICGAPTTVMVKGLRRYQTKLKLFSNINFSKVSIV